VAIVQIDVSEESIAFITSVTRNGEPGIKLAVINTRSTPRRNTFLSLMIEAIRSSEKSILTRATQSNITEDGILLKKKKVLCHFKTHSFLLVN
jgi:hypothetical protein